MQSWDKEYAVKGRSRPLPVPRAIAEGVQQSYPSVGNTIGVLSSLPIGFALLRKRKRPFYEILTVPQNLDTGVLGMHRLG